MCCSKGHTFLLEVPVVSDLFSRKVNLIQKSLEFVQVLEHSKYSMTTVKWGSWLILRKCRCMHNLKTKSY